MISILHAGILDLTVFRSNEVYAGEMVSFEQQSKDSLNREKLVIIDKFCGSVKHGF